ncbi:hypothetical protein BDP27DRAFT_1219526 [Rhodocollybia butyracea]|uniref:DUF427 domain-containing protein n=1 Tax=Rhodocollybia butyracea TaxID=206335 RepID=A0A9P5PY53_9AGAR|nr:hypothetical protein BDP27DRAFT_1219526 [Rhodocollybia butyracea]
MKAIFNGVVIAESTETKVVEGNHYFPHDSVQTKYFTDSDTPYTCPWKGPASYYNATIEGQNVPDIAWYYPKTITDRAKPIENYVAFDKVCYFHLLYLVYG